MRLSDAAERAIQQLVERTGMHDDLALCLPVPIRQIVRDEGWTLQYKEFIAPLYGYAVIGKHEKVMVISADITRPWQRHTMAHEMGHVLNEDEGGLHFCQSWPWLADKTERRASVAAGKLLIPDAALTEIGTVAGIAAACDVPLDLVQLRIAAMDGL